MPQTNILARMTSRHDVIAMGRAGWHEVMQRGHTVDADALAGFEYRGVSLGLPNVIERLSWKTFQKVFFRDEVHGPVRGWNVRVEQRGLDAPSVPKMRRGRPFTFGHFVVVPASPYRMPRAYGGGLMLDYGPGANPWHDPMRFLRDPVVAVNAGDSTLLLGWSYVDVAGFCLPSPSYFVLERERPITHVP